MTCLVLNAGAPGFARLLIMRESIQGCSSQIAAVAWHALQIQCCSEGEGMPGHTLLKTETRFEVL